MERFQKERRHRAELGGRRKRGSGATRHHRPSSGPPHTRSTRAAQGHGWEGQRPAALAGGWAAPAEGPLRAGLVPCPSALRGPSAVAVPADGQVPVKARPGPRRDKLLAPGSRSCPEVGKQSSPVPQGMAQQGHGWRREGEVTLSARSSHAGTKGEPPSPSIAPGRSLFGGDSPGSAHRDQLCAQRCQVPRASAGREGLCTGRRLPASPTRLRGPGSLDVVFHPKVFPPGKTRQFSPGHLSCTIRVCQLWEEGTAPALGCGEVPGRRGGAGEHTQPCTPRAGIQARLGRPPSLP